MVSCIIYTILQVVGTFCVKWGKDNEITVSFEYHSSALKKKKEKKKNMMVNNIFKKPKRNHMVYNFTRK